MTTPAADVLCVAVAPDDAPGAVPAAALLAAQTGARLRLLAVEEAGWEDPTLAEHLLRCEDVARRAGADQVSSRVIRRRAGVRVADRLLEALAASPPLLVAMSTRARGAIAELALGSVSSAVLARSGLPVLLTRHDMPPVVRYDRVVLCTDGSADAARALDVAAELARRSGATLWVVEAVEPDVVPPDVVESAAVEALAASVAGRVRSVAYDVVHGPAGSALVEFAGTGTTLLVMGTYGRSAARRLLTGSVTRHVVRHGSVPVAVVPPARTS